MLCARDETRLRAVVDKIKTDFPVRVTGVPADVAAPDGVAALAEAVTREFGGADILINNAGTGSEETILEAPDERWQAYWELHVMAAVRLARALAPGMKERGGGVILHNASICATQPLGYEPIYNVTKAALVMFSKCLANELIGDNIRVNAVNPGLVMTPDWQKTAKAADRGHRRLLGGPPAEDRQRQRPDRPLRRPGGDRQPVRLPVLAPSQLHGRLELLHRRRLATHDHLSSSM